MKRTPSVRVGLLIAGICALVYAALGALELLVGIHTLAPGAKYIASCACFGLLLGAIVAFDPLPGERGPDRPLIRVTIGIVSSLLLALLWQWPIEGAALSALVGAALSYTGTMWARYL